ncbi:spore germination protein [Paenibacillus rhizophilus]|uniref:Spore germination protein n=1 Tax=Paenibacillus rhizophilus TaxID=1850366 RepID=A0A3N9PE39_9BACL|nr:spore germination protein [Paenibacillus rhizophilus]RQW13840.1 spore germination protein [Paenibacillus rhizophilus]
MMEAGDTPEEDEANRGTETLQGKGERNGKPKDPKQKKRDKELSNSVEESIEYWHGEDKVPESLNQTKEVLTEVMGLGASFDVVFREMTFGGTKAALLFISGFAKDVILDEILKRLTYLTPEDISSDAFAAFMINYIPHIQVEKSEKLSDAVIKTMSGMSALFVEGEAQVIIMDTRSYPVRGPEEPSIERVVRGARDGFTETLLSNIALVRRRLRDPGLKFELHQVGRRTKTDVSIAYIDDIADKTQVKAVTEKIKSVNIEGIPLADKQLEEAIIGEKWNPYPMVRYSERPDIVASHLLEGRVVVFVDTSPSVMVIPTTFFDLCQHAEENRQTPLMGSYLRWVRFAGIFASIFLLPLWMLFVIHPELKPAPLMFIGPHETAKIPLLTQFLIIEFGVDLLRMAAVHTPSPLGSAMGLIAAILIGDIAVQTGLFVNEVVLYMAVATIGMFATPSYELGLANRVVRLLLLLATGLFHVAGFVIGSTLLIVLLTVNRSYNSSYLWPFIPFNAKAMGAILFRQSVISSKTRPSFNKTRDNTRMSPATGKKDKS